MAGKILLGLGIAGLLVGIAISLITVIVAATGGGRVSGDEAALPLGGGCCCSLISLALFITGLVMVLKARKKAAADQSNQVKPP